ncbi:MAG: hypothetical protein FJW40_19825 [Acidobacteria bacterium]|nr:hypothetical protein [Acidobacteriota bacterium]
MTTDRWRTLRDLFDEASRLGPVGRTAFLDQHCVNDPALRQELESLLGLVEKSEEFLETPALQQNFSFAAIRVGQTMGNFRLVRWLGQGGMGTVYEAQRLSEPHDRVAIKIMRGLADSPHLLRRFTHERKTLGALDHPNIGRLLDGGTSPEGQPYLVIEFVDGQPFDRYVRSNEELGQANHLRLFAQLCEAVQYAHEQKCLHRDIKLGNVLVDHFGRVKLLDFGIAKMLDDETLPAMTRTATMVRILTPEYACPEMLRGGQPAVSWDIYSLGVMLYELVAGTRPYHSPSTSLEELIKHIDRSEPDPLPPGTPRALNRIIRKAIHRDPARRYQTVAGLREDIQRYLTEQTVLARPDGWAYRIRRWTLRPSSRWILAGAAIAAAALGLSAYIHDPWREGVLSYLRPVPVTRVFVASMAASEILPERQAVAAELDSLLRAELPVTGVLMPVERTSVLPARNPTHPDRIPDEVLRAVRDEAGALLVTTFFTSHDSTSGPKHPAGSLELKTWLVDSSDGRLLASTSTQGALAEKEALAARTAAALARTMGGPSFLARARRSPHRDEAAQLYADGRRRLKQFDLTGARRQLERAVNRNPAHAMAHAALSMTLTRLGYRHLAEQESRQVVDLARTLGPVERLEADAVHYQAVANWNAAVEARQRLVHLLPADAEQQLALAELLMRANRHGEAGAQVAAVRRHTPGLHADWLALQLGQSLDTAAFLDSVRAAGSPQWTADVLACLANQAIDRNHGEAARPHITEARSLYEQTGDRQALIRLLMLEGMSELREGRPAAGIKLFEQALDRIPSTGLDEVEQAVQLQLGLAHRAAGDLAAAERAYSRGLSVAWQAELPFYLRNLMEELAAVQRTLGRPAQGSRKQS